MPRNTPTQEHLLSRLSYDKETGHAIWKKKEVISSEEKRWNTSFSGKRAGRGLVGKRGNKSAWYISIDGHPYIAHRLFWIMSHGSIPDGCWIDHVNGDPYDNRLCNLRLCNNATNQANRLAPKNNRSGFKGVSWCSARKKYKVGIKDRGVHIHGGYYDSKGMAAVAAAKISLRIHGRFSPYYRQASITEH